MTTGCFWVFEKRDMSKQLTFADITARKHRGAVTSKEANPSQAVKREAHQAILHWLAESINGHTSKELAELLGKPLNAISGRLSELKAMGEIEETGQRRNGAAVLRVK